MKLPVSLLTALLAIPAAAVHAEPDTNPAAVAATPIKASWQPQKLHFYYVGSTTFYSCRAIKSKVTDLLEHFGAKQIKVGTGHCVGDPGTPQTEAMRLNLTFNSLTEARNDGDTVDAGWTTVRLANREPRNFETGDCELLEHFVRYVLPAFSHKKVDGKVSCVPGQLTQYHAVSVPVLKAAADAG